MVLAHDTTVPRTCRFTLLDPTNIFLNIIGYPILIAQLIELGDNDGGDFLLARHRGCGVDEAAPKKGAKGVYLHLSWVIDLKSSPFLDGQR